MVRISSSDTARSTNRYPRYNRPAVFREGRNRTPARSVRTLHQCVNGFGTGRYCRNRSNQSREYLKKTLAACSPLAARAAPPATGRRRWPPYGSALERATTASTSSGAGRVGVPITSCTVRTPGGLAYSPSPSSREVVAMAPSSTGSLAA